MADPITLAGVGMAATAGGGVMGAIGSIMGGDAQANMYKYQAGVAKVNQQIAAQNAEWALKSGDVEAQQAGLKARYEIGTAKTEQAASGFDVNAGSAKLTRQSMQEVGTENEEIIRANTAKRAYGFQVQGIQEEAQANLDTMAAQQSKEAGMIGAFSSILGSASSFSSKWTQGKSIGIFL